MEDAETGVLDRGDVATRTVVGDQQHCRIGERGRQFAELAEIEPIRGTLGWKVLLAAEAGGRKRRFERDSVIVYISIN